MKRLRFQYHMKITFDASVEKHRFTLKCIPLDSGRQLIKELSVEVFPNSFISRGYDSFGNLCIYGYEEQEHREFHVEVAGLAVTGLSEEEQVAKDYQVGYFKIQTPCTLPGPLLRGYHQQFSFSGETGHLDKAMDFMEGLHRDFAYVKGLTDVETTAEEAFAKGGGVCQDFSHILLSLCRMEEIPCRYVVGMLLGEGLSHAWVEIYQDGKWIAIDPTNQLMVTDEHIKISCGRDYQDCSMNQGVFYGMARQHQEVRVIVEEAAEWRAE